MRRRRFLQVGIAAGVAGLAGCTSFGGGGNRPPPRKSAVFQTITVNEGTLAVELESDPWVNSRAEVDASTALSVAPPIGVAAGDKGGSRGVGATGRGSGGWISAPKRRGYAVYHGYDDDDWREDNRDEVRQYDAVPVTVGLGYLGTAAAYSEDPPEVGRLEQGWDQTWSDPEAGQQLTMSLEQPGWYRIGTELQSENGDHNFGWESVDFEVDQEGEGYDVENPWKISPRV
jgi:hypothetical protein